MTKLNKTQFRMLVDRIHNFFEDVAVAQNEPRCVFYSGIRLDAAVACGVACDKAFNDAFNYAVEMSHGMGFIV